MAQSLKPVVWGDKMNCEEGKIQKCLRDWLGSNYKSTLFGIATTATALATAYYQGELSAPIIALALGGLFKSWFQTDSNGGKH